MNYTTHVLEEFVKFCKRLRKADKPIDAAILESVCVLLSDSPKFLLPAGNKLGIEVKADAFPLIHLPYPVTVLEYPVDLSIYKTFNTNAELDQVHMSSKRVIICIDNSSKDLPFAAKIILDGLHEPLKEVRGFYLISIYFTDDSQEWHIGTGIVFVPLELITATNIIYADPNKTSHVTCRVTALLPSVEQSMKDSGMSEENRLKILEGDVSEDVICSIKALMCLSARNTMVLNIDAPHKLNKKRLRKGMLPYYEYKVLDIFLTPDARRAVKFTAQEIHGQLMKFSSEAFRRLHSVRGHYKIRKAGIFWWNPFVRGKRSAGEIKKDYDVKEQV